MTSHQQPAQVPSKATSFVRHIGGVLSSAAREFVWADLREGVVRLNGLSRFVQSLVLLGFALLFTMLGILLFNGPLREISPLLPIFSGSAGRGQVIPFILMPVTLFVFSVAWSFMLAGALRARLSVGLGILFMYMIVGAIWTSTSASGSLLWMLIWVPFLAIPILFLIGRRAKPRPGVELAIIIGLTSLIFGLAQIHALELWRGSGIPLSLATIQSVVYGVGILAVPFILFIGMDIAEFVHRTASWTSSIADEWLGKRALYSILFVFLGWRVYGAVSELVERLDKSSLAQEAAAYAGALAIPVIVGAAWWVIGRRGGAEISVERTIDVAKKTALPLIAAYMGMFMVGIILIFLTGILGIVLVASGLGGDQEMKQGLQLAGQFVSQAGNWQLLLAAGVLSAAAWMVYRGKHVLALYLGITGANALWLQLTNSGQGLSNLSWSGMEPVDFWWIVTFTAITVFWLIRKQLTEVRARRLLFLVFITVLLRQTEFIEDPFSPVLGFSGIAIIAIGVFWDSLMVGAWANNDSPRMPRTSRIFLYLGYVLFSVAVVNWAVAAHDTAQVDFFAGQAALAGFSLFGKPMIYAIFAITLALPAGAMLDPDSQAREETASEQPKELER